jgi:hypothetical protein
MLSVLQWIGFLFLSCVSFFFTCNLALGLGMDRTEKVALVAGSLAIEVLKMYALIAANTYAHRDRAFSIHHRKTGLMYGAYVFVAMYSLAACFGFALATVDRMTAATTTISHADDIAMENNTIAAYDDAIGNIERGLSDKQKTLASVPQDRIARMNEVQKMILADQSKLDEYITKKDVAMQKMATWRAEEQRSRSNQKRSMYAVIGETTGIQPRWVAFIILAVFSIAIELGIFVTSPHGDVPIGNRDQDGELGHDAFQAGATTAGLPAVVTVQPAISASGHQNPPIENGDTMRVMHSMAYALRSLSSHAYQHKTPCDICQQRIEALALYDSLHIDPQETGDQQ